MPDTCTLTLLLPVLLALCPYCAQAQDSLPEAPGTQALKEAAARDPFAHKDKFTIDCRQYAEGTDWTYPLPGGKVISPYGGRRHHAGTDIKTRPNDTIRAAFAGHVTLSGPYYGYGNTVILRHANGLETLYSHQSKNLCKKGDWVQAGQPIGLTGRTGRASTEHLHLETRIGGRAFDSAKLFDHANHRLWQHIFVFKKHGNSVKVSSEK